MEKDWNLKWLSYENRGIPKQGAALKIRRTVFIDEAMFFLLGLTWNLSEYAFSRVKTKANFYFTAKYLEEVPFIFYLFDESNYSNICSLDSIIKTLWNYKTLIGCRKNNPKQPAFYFYKFFHSNSSCSFSLRAINR